jgi:hypothetical protein
VYVPVLSVPLNSHPRVVPTMEKQYPLSVTGDGSRPKAGTTVKVRGGVDTGSLAYFALAVKLWAVGLTASPVTGSFQMPVLASAVAVPLDAVPSKISTVSPLDAVPSRVTLVSAVVPP